MITTQSPSKAKVRELISGVVMFRTTSDKELDVLAAGSKVVNVAKGKALFHQGEECKGFYLVLSGGVRLVFTAPDGREHNAMIAGRGAHFAEAVMLLGAAYPLDAYATEDAGLLFIGKAAVDACIDSNPSFARILIANLSTQLHQFSGQIAKLTLQNATQRVIGYLLTHMDADAKIMGCASFTLPASKNDIALHLNISPETLSRTLRQLDEADLIIVKGRNITIPNMEEFRNFGSL